MTDRRRQFYSPQEVGDLTGFSATFIRAEIKAGELKGVFVRSARSSTGRWRIRVADAEAYASRIGVSIDGTATRPL